MTIRELNALQELDWIRGEKQQLLADVRDELADDSALNDARRSLSNLDAQYARQNALRRDAQLAVEQIEGREAAVQRRLYGGAITNPRELEAMQEEQSMLRRQRAEAEDLLLEHMVETEELQEALDAERRNVSELDTHRRERVPILRERENALSEELKALDSRRLEVLPRFTAQLLSLYETLLGTRGGHAVSRVESSRGREICGACRVALPRSDVQGVRSGDAIVQCNNCRRILYME